MATRVNLSFWLANFQNLTYLKLGSNALKLYRIVNNNGFSKLATFRAAQKAPVASFVEVLPYTIPAKFVPHFTKGRKS
jgi:hypothetical protein